MLKMQRHGSKGRMFYSNGDIYEGEWKLNKREGQGKMHIEAEKATIIGTFSNDQVVTGKLTDHVGNVFMCVNSDKDPGRFEKGLLCGRVSVKYANGDTFVGIYREGKKCGFGTHNY